MFFFQNHLRIKNLMHSCIEVRSDAEEQGAIARLLELRTLLAYIYTHVHPGSWDPFLRNEHASLYLFWPKKVSRYLIWGDHNVEPVPRNRKIPSGDKWGEIDGYEGRLNGRTHIWVAKGSCIYPPSPRIWLNQGQDTYHDLHRLHSRGNETILDYFLSEERDPALVGRISTALAWHNRSASSGIEDEESLIFLSIAFETLLNLEKGEAVTRRFKEAVKLLVGGFPRLDSWAAQFYQARSDIVHDGTRSELRFIAADLKGNCRWPSGQSYRPLVTYGYLIFRACVNAILAGVASVGRSRLPRLMKTNVERLRSICQTLDSSESDPEEKLVRIQQDAFDVETFRFEPEEIEIALLVGAAKAAVKQYLKMEPSAEGPHSSALEAFVASERDSQFFCELAALRDLQDFVKAIQHQNPNREDAVASVVASLLDTVWHYTFMHYFAILREKDE